MKFRSIFISDVHLGSRDCKAESLLRLFKEHESENLYLIGDIIDGWALKRRWYWPQEHSDVIQKVLRKARKGTNVYYILGNHDEFVRHFLPITFGDSLMVSNEEAYVDLKGRRHYVVHGDLFDSITMNQKWLAHFGDRAYAFLLRINRPINFVRKLVGYNRYWSLSKYVKQSVKKSVNFITRFEEILATQAEQNGYDGVICGHIHKAEIREIDAVMYLNSGDWVESCTALVETFEGKWQIVEYLEHE